MAAGLALALAGCVVPGNNPEVPTPNSIAADDPLAAEAALAIMTQGGNAVDAMVASSLVMAVTLPSRMSLGAYGTCISAVSPAPGPGGALRTELPMNVQVLRIDPVPLGDGAAVVPALARGLFALHAEAGRLRWAQVVAPAEQIARFGFPMSRGLQNDLQAVGAFSLQPGPLRNALFGPDGGVRPLGTTILRPALADTLSTLRRSGGVLSGSLLDNLAAELSPARPQATADQVRDTTPVLAASDDAEIGSDILSTPSLRVTRAALAGVPDGAAAQASAVAIAALSADDVSAACSFTLGGLFGTGTEGAQTGVIPGQPGPVPDQVAVLHNPFTLNHLGTVAGADGDAAFLATLDAVIEDEVDARTAVDRAAGGRVAAVVCPTDFGAVTGCSSAIGAGSAGLARTGF